MGQIANQMAVELLAKMIDRITGKEKKEKTVERKTGNESSKGKSV